MHLRSKQLKQPDLVFRLFPFDVAEIRREFDADPAFREVCEDLEAADRALRYWQEKERVEVDKVREYSLLRDELADELQKLLDLVNNSRAIDG